jgi:hypothetical protein
MIPGDMSSRNPSAAVTIIDSWAQSMPAPQAALLRDSFSLPVVIDTTAVFDDLLYRTRPEPGFSSLLVATQIGCARLIAKDDLPAELDRNLARIAADENRDPAVMRQMINGDYLPWIRLVNVTGIAIESPRLRAVAGRHINDEPTARLSLLVDPSLVLTLDNDLLDNGFGVWKEPGLDRAKWSHSAATVRDGSLPIVAVGSAQLAAIVGVLLAGAVLELVREHPTIATTVALAATGALIVATQSDRAATLANRAANGVRDARDAIARIAGPWPQAASQLAAYRSEHPGLDSPVARLARVLALGPSSGLLVSEIRGILPDIQDVPGLLGAYPAFVQVDRWHWTLGQVAAER